MAIPLLPCSSLLWTAAPSQMTNLRPFRTNLLVFSSPPEYQLSLSLTLRPTVSRPVCLGIKHPSRAYDQIFIIVWQLRVCWFWAPSLTRGRVCRLQLQLVLASTVIFGSESRRTRGHSLLSHIWDFPFRRLLRLARSRWRYSTPPPHGSLLQVCQLTLSITHNISARINRKHSSSIFASVISIRICFLRSRYPATAAYTCLLKICCLATNFVSLSVSRSIPSNDCTRYNVKR
jgi:hypothetical protein